MVYISLTTVPDRLIYWEGFKRNLDSLLTQETDVQYKVILNLPYLNKKSGEEYIVPDGLYEYENNSNFIIHRTQDWGPITKVLGALECIEDPDALLIVCDDDHVYDPRMIKYHLLKQDKYENKKIIAFRADLGVKKVEIENEKGKGYYYQSALLPYPCTVDTEAKIPGHWHSVSYRRGLLKDEFLFDEDFLSLTSNDDLLIAYYASKHHITIVVPKFDEETDWSPINHYRPGYCFPILEPVSHNQGSGFARFRADNNHHNGVVSQKLLNEIHFNGIRYYTN